MTKPSAKDGYPMSGESTTAPAKSPSSADPKDDPRRLILTKESWTATVHPTGSMEERYAVLEELGRGGFGAVSKVQRREDGAVLAAKSCMQPTERLLQEAELWETVSTPYHDAVLQLVEVMRAADGLHLITELMPYGELYDALDSIVFSEQACRMVTVQVASALAHLHLRHKIAHCDVKPANVLCRLKDPTTPGSLKLCDYGFAQRFVSRKEASFTVSCGTLDYFAPEVRQLTSRPAGLWDPSHLLLPSLPSLHALLPQRCWSSPRVAARVQLAKQPAKDRADRQVRPGRRLLGARCDGLRAAPWRPALLCAE